MRDCRHCAEPINDTAQVCHHCGGWQQDSPTPENRQSVRKAYEVNRSSALSFSIITPVVCGGIFKTIEFVPGKWYLAIVVVASQPP